MLVLIGVGAGLLASLPKRTTLDSRVLVAGGFGLGLLLTRRNFPFMSLGLVVVAVSAGFPGAWPRWRAGFVASFGLALTLLAASREVSPSVVVPAILVFVPLALLARPETGAQLPLLVAALTAASQFGVYAAVPDTEFAVGVGGVAVGLALVGWRPGVDVPLVLAISTVVLTITVGSARTTEIALQAMPALGMLAVLAIPKVGERLESKLVEQPRLQVLAFAAHFLVCGIPRWLIIGKF